MIFAQSAGMGIRSGIGVVASMGSAGDGLRSRLSLAGLPSIPQVLVRLLELFQSDTTSFKEIAEYIQQDVAMTARVISIASSASQHGRHKPASLDQCLTVLGMSTIKTIVVNESVFQVFRRLVSEKDFDLGGFWAHSLRCALIARALAKASGETDPGEAYLGGLLHDVGQLAMLTADPSNYLPLFVSQDDPSELCRREQVFFDITHAEVGAWLIEKWDLDSLLADSVLYHHDKVERLNGAHPMIRVVNFADRLAVLQGNAQALAKMDLAGHWVPDGVDLHRLLEQAEAEMAEMARQLGISLSSPIFDAGLRQHSLPPTSIQDRSQGERALAERVRDVVLIGNALNETDIPDDQGEALEHIIRALCIVFDIQTELCFLPQRGEKAGRYVASPVVKLNSRASRFEFVRAESQSEVSRCIDQGLRFLEPVATLESDVLDDQLMRMVGKPGMIYLPLIDGSSCHAVLVAGLDKQQQEKLSQEGMLCLEQFLGMAGRLLSESGIRRSARTSDTDDHGQESYRIRMQKVVHEVGNPLSVIQNYLALLEQKFVEKDIDRRELLIVTREIERLSRILGAAVDEQDVLPERSETVSVNALIEDMVALCRPDGAQSPALEIRTALHPDLQPIPCHGDSLRQLILNLLKNSLEALSDSGGVIYVSTRPWKNEKGPQFVEICIEDSGPGLPPGVLDRLYQPVASSKGMLHQGIGLAIVGQLVRELDGLINCRSSDRGTCFQILLPLNS